MTTYNKSDALTLIKGALSREEKFKVININGEFLTGKTSLIQELISDIDFINQYNVYSYINDWEKYNYLFDITADFFENSNLSHPEFISSESKYFVTSFFDSLSALNISNKDLFKEVNEYLLADSPTELTDALKQEIEKNISSGLKRNLVLHYYPTSIECIIADLISNFLPLNQQIESISEYLLSREPIKILLFFDDTQTLSPKVLKWIKEIFTYMTDKRLGDLLLYDYQGNDSQILLGEFFSIDLIFINRNKSLDLSGNDIYTVNLPLGYPSEKESYSDYANVIEKSKFESTPIWAIPALANYYVLVEEDKDPMTSIFAVNHLLKYVPTEFQRAVIFSSIFDEFNLVNINLFQEIKLTPDDYQNLLSRIDFVEVLEGGNRLKEVSRKILFNVCKIIFKDTDFDMLIATSTQIKDKFPGLRYDQFEILRELAYFKVFDKSFVIENYFDNDKNTLQLIETYPEYFERDKSFYAIAPNYSDILIEYNKVCDGEDYALKCQKVEEIYYNYQKEIEKRNAVLQEDVINVGKELEEHSAQKNMMAEEADLFVKQLLNLKGNIKEIDEKLKPFVHINSKKKSTINLIALIASVAIIFNSDRISEILFGSSSDFGYVILITFILLLGLYGNGLLRYFRIKFKSEELHALKQSKKNKENECEKIQSELDIKNADIRAKEAKIEDLKKHIERMNKQIFENKNKLGKTFMH